MWNDLKQTKTEGVWYLVGYLSYFTFLGTRLDMWLWDKDFDQYRYGQGTAEHG